MVYKRGGKVWIESADQAWVFLENDWQGDRLPEDLVEEAGILGVNFRPGSSWERAEFGGYAWLEEDYLFYLSDRTLKFHNLEDQAIFLLGDFNDWKFSPSWRMEPLKDGVAIKLKPDELGVDKPFEFKFATMDGRWIEPHQQFPSVVDRPGYHRNYLFDPRHRTGKDLVRFDVVNPPAVKEMDDLLATRPGGEFGYLKTNPGCSFRFFAPRASKVRLCLFNGTDQSLGASTHQMSKQTDGSWVVELPTDAEGMSYLYEVCFIEECGKEWSKTITDPYARAMISRNGPGLAIAVKSQKERFTPPPIEDIVVVEAHVRDLLAHADHPLSDDERMGFAGLTKWLDSDGCYLKKLGANVVELQPVQEFDARKPDEYHWGYMPVNFFSPASCYGGGSNSAKVPEEFSDLVKAFHEAEMAVVIDVVYNHMGIPPNLLYADRDLYFLTDGSGSLTNHSGCGNDLRCEAEPVRKLILDSLIYWVEKFDVDGFRFDLGELIGWELLCEIQRELKAIKPGILLFAEPWSFRGRLPVEMNQTSYALWSDECREGLLKYVRGQSDSFFVERLIRGELEEQNKHPCQSLNYLESHDDYSFVDRFRDQYHWGEGDDLPNDVRSLACIAMGLLLLSPGVPMISAGQDFLRDKKGVRNTYLRGDLNALHYSLSEKYEQETSFVRAMIGLRLSEHGLRARKSTMEKWNLEFFRGGKDHAVVVSWHADNNPSARYLVFVNTGSESARIEIPGGLDFSVEGQTLASYGGEVTEGGTLPPRSFNWMFFG